MIHIQDQQVLQTSKGCTALEYEEFCRLYLAGILQLSPPCLSSFRADHHVSEPSYIPMTRWIETELIRTKMGPVHNFYRMRTELDEAGVPVISTEVVHVDKHNMYTKRIELERLGSSAFKTAADIPAELFSSVLDYIAADARYENYEAHRTDLRVLGNCSLVCSEWANHCRPLLFQLRLANVTTGQQMRSLRTMSSWGTSQHLKDLKQRETADALFATVSVYVGDTKDTGPWLHHLGLLKLKLSPVCHLAFRGGNTLARRPLLRPIGLLPKTLLPSTFIPYTELSLSDFRTPSLAILVRFLRQFVLVRRFNISRVIWEDKHAIHFPRAPRHSRFRPGPFYVNVSASQGEPDISQLFWEICTFYPDFPLHHLHEGDSITARLLWSTDTCIKGFARWTGMAWDGFTDTVSFLRQLKDDTFVIAAFTCSLLNPSSLPNHRLLTALCILCGGLIRREGTVEGPGIARSIDFRALHATVREATSLMVLMISFNDFDVLRQLAARDNPFSGSPHITYRWSCRRRRYKPLPLIGDGSLDLDFHGSPRIHDRFRRSQLKSEFASHWYMKTLNKRTRGDSEYFAYVWELIDPLTVRPTGDTFFEHDNIVPELLRRQGVHVATAPDCPSEDEIREKVDIQEAIVYSEVFEETEEDYQSDFD